MRTGHLTTGIAYAFEEMDEVSPRQNDRWPRTQKRRRSIQTLSRSSWAMRGVIHQRLSSVMMRLCRVQAG